MLKKSFKNFAISWLVFLIVFNVSVFVAKSVIPGYTVTHDGRFWVAWSFIILAFLGELACAYFVFKEENATKLFYKIPIIKAAYTGLVFTLIIGCILMLIPNCPAWIAVIVCVILLSFNVSAVMKRSAAAKLQEQTDEKVKEKVSFMKTLSGQIKSLLPLAKDAETKSVLNKAFETVRYSDPVSSDALFEIEGQMGEKFTALSKAVKDGDKEAVKTLAEEFIALTESRKALCKALK